MELRKRKADDEGKGDLKSKVVVKLAFPKLSEGAATSHTKEFVDLEAGSKVPDRPTSE